MNIASPSLENAGLFTLACGYLKFWANKIVEVTKKIKKLEQDDLRRIIHSLKVGLALTLVSLFYYIQPLYDHFGKKNVMWAIFTVIILSLSFLLVSLYIYIYIYKPIYGITASELELKIPFATFFFFIFFPQ